MTIGFVTETTMVGEQRGGKEIKHKSLFDI